MNTKCTINVNRELSSLIFPDRDVVKYLTDCRITNIQDFDWISQLRYYWKVNESEFTWGLNVSAGDHNYKSMIYFQKTRIGCASAWWSQMSNMAWNTWATCPAWW